jgi:hypothetical protein
MRKASWIPAAALLGLLPALAALPRADAADTAEALLARVKAVGQDGAGSAEAAAAWKELVRLGPGALPAIFAAMDDDNPRLCNWLRTAVDAIGEQTLKDSRPLPAGRLETFVQDTNRPRAARRLAYDWLCRADRTAPDRLLRGMLHDPSPELRRDAVARVADEAKRLLDRGDKAAATAAYRKAFDGACDDDQVDELARQLKALGVTVDVPGHFGFIRRWHLVGPFDHTGSKAFNVAYPPEKGVDLSATYKGKGGADLRWVVTTTDDLHGAVDVNKALGKHPGAVAYAFAAVVSPAERPVQIRAGSTNGLKVFVNGKEVFAREEYHHGQTMDQYTARATLRAGRNEILLKVCQNEQTDSWAQNWSFQARLCDPAGEAVPWSPAPDPAAREAKR